MDNKQYYGYNQCVKDSKELLPKIKLYNPDTLVSIARGGLTFGHLLASGLDNRNLYTINSIHYDDNKKLDNFKISNIPNLTNSKKVLIIDDIIDSGETMREIINILKTNYPQCEYKTTSLFYKRTALLQPDFTINEAKKWIEFFWEVDI